MPFAEGRTAYEQNGVRRGELNAILLFKFPDLIRKGLCDAVGKGQRCQQQQKGSQHFHDHDFVLLHFDGFIVSGIHFLEILFLLQCILLDRYYLLSELFILLRWVSFWRKSRFH
jgi:hypothetical protein